MKTLLVIMGATAVGKTRYCVELAQRLKTEIISGDSRQFYHEMQIGTARPTREEMQAVPHHFVGSHSIHEPLNVAQYEIEALNALNKLFEKHETVILTGGSGLYLQAVYRGLDPMPPSNPQVREVLEQRLEAEGVQSLADDLRRFDPVYAAEADLQNPRRVVRALEVIEVSGKPFSSFRNQQPKEERPFAVKKVILDRPREELYERINRRVDLMVKAGLLDEVKQLFPYRDLVTLQTVGYQELFDFLEGKTTFEEAIELIKRNTRRYAKRQLTWFRRQTDAEWVKV